MNLDAGCKFLPPKWLHGHDAPASDGIRKYSSDCGSSPLLQQEIVQLSARLRTHRTRFVTSHAFVRTSWKMSGARQNTLVVDFSVLPVRPEVSKVHHFLENELKLQYADIKSIQLHHSRNCVLIEMRSEVTSIRNEKWKHYFPGISNGVRVLRMNLLRPIPSFITIDNEETMVSYNEQQKSCRLCTQPYHPGNKCPERSTTPAAENPPTSITSKSSDGLFTPDDFPPITNDRQKTPSPVLANETTEEGTNPAKQQSDNDDDDWTDDNDASNSSTEHNRTTHKRRRSRRDNKDRTKKACADQCSPNTDHEDQLIIR